MSINKLSLLSYFTKPVWRVLALCLCLMPLSACVNMVPNPYSYDREYAEPRYSKYVSDSESTSFEAEYERILAPIALYPDSLLTHILVASTYPLEVVQAQRWTRANSDLDAQTALNEAGAFDWDPSVQALVAFPQILERMADDLDWTIDLGNAFLDDQAGVLDSVQTLRVLAQEAGSLDQMDKLVVTRDSNAIIIEPRERHIVYVPYYDTRSVYGAWRWHSRQPVYWDYPFAYNRHAWRYGGDPFYWSPSVSVSFGFFSSAFHWGNRHLVHIPFGRFHPHTYYGYRDILGHRQAQRWHHNRFRDGRRGHRSSGYERHHNGQTYRDSRHADRRQTSTRNQRGVIGSRVLEDRRRVANRQLNRPMVTQSRTQPVQVIQSTPRTSSRTSPQPNVRPSPQIRSQTQRPVSQASPSRPNTTQPVSRPVTQSQPRAVNRSSAAKPQSESRAPRRQPR